MKIVSFILLAFLSIMGAKGQGIEFLHDPEWKDVIEVAKQQDKLIFVDCYTVW